MGSTYSVKSYKTNPSYKDVLIYSQKSYINPVARAYFDKVSAAGGNVADKTTINNFTNAMCQILPPELWVFYPLRSSQNIGATTTAFSLGNLGNFPGTLTNGPVWGANGLTFGTDDYISTTIPVLTNTGNWSCGLVLIGTNIIAGSTFLSFSSEGKTPLFSQNTGISVGQSYLGNSVRGVTASLDWTSAYRSVSVIKSSNIMTGYTNGALSGSGSITTGGTDAMTFRPGGGGGNPANEMIMTCAFYFDTILTAAQASSIHSLLKTTLAQGLIP